MRYGVNIPRVAGEVVEGEAILIDLETGAYYSSEGLGAEIWQLVASGFSVADTVAVLARRYPGRDGEIAVQVPQFMEELAARHLVVAMPQGSAGSSATLPTLAEPEQYSSGAPRLHRHAGPAPARPHPRGGHAGLAVQPGPEVVTAANGPDGQ